MNCAECRDNLVAWQEGLLDDEQSRQCRNHLDSCQACRAEQAVLVGLQERLTASARTAAGISLATRVMRQVQAAQPESERMSLMSRLLQHRWGFGLSLGAGATAIILCLLLITPKAHARAADVLARGAQAVAKLSSIHLRGQLRTLPADNFSFILPDGAFYPIELWKQFEPNPKWRIEKPGRVIVMDGQSTVMFIKPNSSAVKVAHPTASAFDTEWLHRIANLSNTITNELNNAQAKGWKLSLEEHPGADGRAKAIVTVMATPGVPDNDYLKNAFMEGADTRRVYRFDSQSELLEAVQVYVTRPSGEVQVFELNQIEYNQPFDASVWNLDMPTNVSWVTLDKDLPKLPDNEKYAAMTALEAARAFFEACSRKDWDEAAKFMSPVNDQLKQSLGGLEIVSLGQPFTSKTYPGVIVPYEIKLPPRELNMRVSNANPAKRYLITGLFDQQLKLKDDLTWRNPPVVLPNNEVYARLSPTEAAKAYFDARSKLDWDEMRKFAPDYDVANDQGQIAMAKKMGADVQKLIPTCEVLEATWSAEQAAWFVKFRESGTKKWNLAVRKDNPVHRWQVDGGI